MSTSQANRKRNRSAEADFHPQSKYFINQRIVNSLDQNYMKTIFDKNVGLLFEGAKNNSNNNQLHDGKRDKFKSVRLDGEGNAIFTDGSIGNSDKISCSSCDRLSLIQSECSNCNLSLCEHCEHCGVSCGNCQEAHICKHCVQLFESNFNSQPCCRICKMFT